MTDTRNDRNDAVRPQDGVVQADTHAPILIIGAGGKTGARVKRLLEARGLSTRAVSRSTTPSFDWNDSSHWADALRGVKQAYVTYQPDLAVPAAEAAIRSFLEHARLAGLEHVVLLSGRGEPGAQRAEAVLQHSGLAWNVLRCSWFSQNFSENFLLGGVLSGELVVPDVSTPEPFIDADDIADVALDVLTRPALRNQLFELTGPRAITFADTARILEETLGRRVAYRPVPVDAYLGELERQGYPEDLRWLLRLLFTEVLDGRNVAVTGGVEAVLGRAPRDFREYAERARASGVWSIAQDAEHTAATGKAGVA